MSVGRTEVNGADVRLVDLRSSGAAPPATVEVRVSEAAELLRLLGVLVSGSDHEYDVGVDRIGLVRAAMGDDLLGRASELSGADDKVFFSLSNVAARLDAPGDVDQLLTLLDDEPALPWRLLLSIATDDWDWDAEPADGRAIAVGDPDAIARLRACCDDESRGAPDTIKRLLDADPVEHGRAVADVVRDTRAAVWGHLGPEAMGAIGRDAEHRRARIAAGDDTATVVLEATNGYALEDDASVRRIMLMPSFWLRPWLIVDQLHDLDTLVLSTPVADAFVALPPEVPAPSLLKLTKALADEGRLKLLRRMSTGPVSLGEASDQLGVAKTTAHHHLSILRQAGLVVMRGDGRATRYALRTDPADAAHDALAAYVPTAGDLRIGDAQGAGRATATSATT